MTGRRSRLGWVGIAAALAAPAAASPFVARALADRVAHAAGEELAAVAAALAPGGARGEVGTEERPEAPAGERQRKRAAEREESAAEIRAPEGEAAMGELSGGGELAEPRAARAGARAGRSSRRGRAEEVAEERGAGVPSRGILVRAATVERAVRSGASPNGAPVPASGMRPAGVALYGVGGFGAGLRDGDVVTAVGGAMTTSVGMVIAAVAGAVRSGAKGISAVVWRDQEKLNVTVEIPPPSRLRRSALER